MTRKRERERERVCVCVLWLVFGDCESKRGKQTVGMGEKKFITGSICTDKGILNKRSDLVSKVPPPKQS